MEALGVTKGTVSSGLPMKVRWFWPQLVSCTPTLLRFRKSVPKNARCTKVFYYQELPIKGCWKLLNVKLN